MTDLPASIGRYKVLGRIGQGGMGVLFLAFDPMLERRVAIKLLRDDNEELRARFTREARSIARLRHPHIVTIFDVGEQDGNPFIAMEYLHGQTLAEVIRGGQPIDVPRKLQLIDELCDGLNYAHKAGIVHRDVKPANVMVEQDGVVKVLDFGIARIAESGMTQAGMLIGTLNYMSPEQVAGDPIDGRSDMFAVGALLYELLAGRQAFPGGLNTGILNKILNTQPTPLAELCPDLDPEVIAIVERALEKQPDNRYPDLQAMRKELQRVKRRLDEQLPGTVVIRPHDAAETTEIQTPMTPSRRPAHTPRAFTDRDELAKRRAAQTAAHLDQARRAMAAGDFDGAVAAAEHALLLNPEEPDALRLLDQVRQTLDERQVNEWLARGAELLRQGRATEAMGFVEQALTLVPHSAAALDLRRSIDRARTEREEARRRHEAARAATVRGRDLLNRGDAEEAARVADEALSLLPDFPDAIVLRSDALEVLIRQRQEESDRQVAASLAEAAALGANDQHEQAVSVLEACRVQDARIDEALRDARARATEQAARLARERAERDRRDRAIADAIARAKAEPSHEKAVAMLTAAQEIDPARADVRGLIESRQVAWAQEREAARLAAERREKVAAALERAHESPSHEDAVAILRDAVALDPSHAEARRALETRREALQREQDALRRAREREERIAAAIVEADRATSHAAAIAILDQGLALDPANTNLRSRLETRQAALDEEREQARRDAERRTAIANGIKQAKGAKSHAEAIALLNEVLALDAANRDARGMLESRQRALDVERAEAERARRIESARASIASLIERGEFDAAEAALRDAESLQAGKAFKDQQRQLRDARRAAAAAAAPATADRRATDDDRRSNARRPAAILGVAGVILAVIAGVYLAIHESAPSSPQPTSPPADARPSSPSSDTPKPTPDAAAPTASATPAPAAPAAPNTAAAPTDPAAAIKAKSSAAIGLAQQHLAQNDVRQAWAVAQAALSADRSNPDLGRLVSDIVARTRQQAAAARALAAGRGDVATGSAAYKSGQNREDEGLRRQRAGRNDEAMRAFLAAQDFFREADREAADRAAAVRAQPPPRPAAPDTGAASGALPTAPAQPPTPVVETPAQPVAPPPSNTPATTPRSSPSPPAAPAADEREAIRATLRAYAAAHASLDAQAVARVYPGVNVDALRRSFADSKSFQVQIDQEQIAISGGEATVTCRVRTTFVPKAGSGRSDVRPTTFKLRKAANQWVIVSRQ